MKNLTKKEAELKRSRTKEGKLKKIYKGQLENSKERGHEPPTYTKTEFIIKFIDCPVYLDYYYSWKISGYKSKYSPSFDRIDDYKGYSFDNIQIMTWQDNRDKYYLDKKEGRNNKISKYVIGTNIKTGDQIEFYSASEASRNGFNRSNISLCCNGKLKTHKKHTWKFKKITL